MVAHPCSARFFYIPTIEARVQFGLRVETYARDAFRAIALAGKGFEIAHLQFRRGNDVVAVSSRVRTSGEIEIEIGVGNPALPTTVFTEEELRKSNRHAASSQRPGPKRSPGPRVT
jgi:hypothetical protein